MDTLTLMPSPLQPFPRHHRRDPWRPADCPRRTGRTLQETLPEGVTNSYQYTVTANTVTETRMTDGNGNVTTYRFNGLGFPVKTIDALGRTFSADIDYATNLTLGSTDPVGRTTRYTYDDHGNRTSVVDPAGNTTLIEYDQTWNQPSRITNALGFTTTLAYTAQRRLASITDGLNHTTRFGYDAQGCWSTSGIYRQQKLGQTTTGKSPKRSTPRS